MQCPKCQSDVWDNGAKVATGWRGPLLKCKNQNCDWLTWPPKAKASPVATQAPIAPQPQPGPSSREAQLGDLYWRCFNEVLTTLKQEKLVDLFHGDAIAAMVATLFIQRAKG